MHYLAESILEVWDKLRDQILGNPAEFERRLQRRQAKLFTHWPRAWCLAVKASDRRINPWYRWSRADTIYNAAGHQVCLTSALIRKLVAPVFVDRPYMETADLARALGRPRQALDRAIDREMFETYRRIPLLGGKRCAVPVVGTQNLLDPGWGKLPRGPHPAWGTLHRYLSDHVPEDIEQWITRIPIWVTRQRVRIYGKTLPPPTPDHAPYKWKNGQYLGEPGDEKRARRRAARAARVAEKYGPNAKFYSDPTPEFIGFRWICPRCAKRARILYYPIELFIIQLLDKEFQPPHPHALPRPLSQFACERCHQLAPFPLHRPRKAWNQLITRLSDALLYGHEVPMPKAFGSDPTYRPQVNASPRRDYVRQRLLEGASYTQIAQEMNIKSVTVRSAAQDLYRHEGLRTLRQFLAHHNKPSPTKRDLVAHHLRLGESNAQIAVATGLTQTAVANHVCALYRRFKLSSRHALIQSLNDTSLPQPPAPADALDPPRPSSATSSTDTWS